MTSQDGKAGATKNDLKMINAAFIGEIFDAIISRMKFIEFSERSRIQRSLRILYFYPDGILVLLDKLIDQNGNTADTIADGYRFLKDQSEVNEELAFITSHSVTTNLSLTIAMVEELRIISSYKDGIRAHLNTIGLLWEFERDPKAVALAAAAVKQDIEILNEQIRRLDAAMRADR
ncbi:hypothetical protein V5F32_13025 [Xanthobacter oligotrophicus]|uniref:Uncharacterized protein n=1 Tax=Xanthobacter oligotrophicus TaxID=2607286 RepID=A0ABW6ZWI1_9HYPH